MSDDATPLRAAMLALGVPGGYAAVAARSPVDVLAARLDLRRSVALADLAMGASKLARSPGFPLDSATQQELLHAAPRLDAFELAALTAIARALLRRGSRTPAAIRAEIARHLDSARQGMRAVRAAIGALLKEISPKWHHIEALDAALAEAGVPRRVAAWTATLDAIETELERSSPRFAAKIERAARALLAHERAAVEALLRAALKSGRPSLSVDTGAENTETSAPFEAS